MPPVEVLITKDPVELQQFLEQKLLKLSKKNKGLALQNLALFKAVEKSPKAVEDSRK